MVEEIVQFSSLAENVVLNSETKFLVKKCLVSLFLNLWLRLDTLK